MSEQASGDKRLTALDGMKAEYLEGPDATQWKVEIMESPPDRLTNGLPEGAQPFAENGFGDCLFLKRAEETVFVFWHEGGEVEEYAPNVAALRPDVPRSASDHPRISYRDTAEIVRLGDRVAIRYWLFFKGIGTVVYVPGMSAKKPSMERDGLAWVRIDLDDGGRVDTIVMPDGALKKSLRFLSRAK